MPKLPLNAWIGLGIGSFCATAMGGLYWLGSTVPDRKPLPPPVASPVLSTPQFLDTSQGPIAVTQENSLCVAVTATEQQVKTLGMDNLKKAIKDKYGVNCVVFK